MPKRLQVNVTPALHSALRNMANRAQEKENDDKIGASTIALRLLEWAASNHPEFKQAVEASRLSQYDPPNTEADTTPPSP